METIVSFVTDEAFVQPTAVALRSLSVHYSGPISIIGDRLTTTNTKLLEVAAQREIHWLEVAPEWITDLPEGRIPLSTYYRIFLANLQPDFDRVLYLDADTLVTSPIEPLLTCDLAGHPVGGVQNLRAPWLASTDGLAGWESMSLNPQAPYINAGVLVLDAKQWREQSLAQAVIASAIVQAQAGSLRQMDQDAINACFAENIKLLDIRNNLHPLIFDPLGSQYEFYSPEQIQERRANPRIVHFIGRSKPWNENCKHPYTKAWRDVARELEPDWYPQKRSLITKFSTRLNNARAGLFGK